MQLRYQYRVYPRPGQHIALAHAFGCARVVWNDALRIREDAYEAGQPFPKSGDLSKQLITQAKQTESRAWLSNAPVGVLQQSLRNLDTAYRNFFDSRSGKRKGPAVGRPRFKSRKDNRQSIRYTKSDRWSITDAGMLRLPKVGDVEVRWTRDLPSEPTTVTVIKDAADRYFVSFVVETDPADEVLPPTDGDFGIDLGLSRFAVLADGSHIASPKYLRRAEKKLKKRQRNLARKKKGSKNRDKARIKVARAHAAVANARRNFHHQWSSKLTRENQAGYAETLNVRGMARGLHSKSVHDAGRSQFLGMLEYKATRYGRTFIKVDRTFPSSQICSACGHRDGPKPLHVRKWTCPNCGTVQDRDWNAGKNIRYEGRRIRAARQTEPSTPGPGARARQRAR